MNALTCARCQQTVTNPHTCQTNITDLKFSSAKTGGTDMTETTSQSNTTKSNPKTTVAKSEKVKIKTNATSGLGTFEATVVTDGDGLRFLTHKGTTYLVRNCHNRARHMDKGVHHTWKSYWRSGKGEDAICDGTGNNPPYTAPPGGWAYATTKKMHDYTTDEDFPVSDPITLTQARAIAYHMHRHQKDKSGEPYRLHLHAVEQGVIVLGGDKDERIAALFHDAVEDDHTTIVHLRSLNVSEKSLDIIKAVSKGWSEEQNAYLDRIKKAGDGAMRVKVADLLHNLRHDRLAVLSEDTRRRLEKKYRPALANLLLTLGVLNSEDDHAKLLAKKPVGSSTGTWTGGGSTSTTKGKSGTTSYAGVGKGQNGRGSEYTVTGLIRGDWPEDYPAPVLRRDTNTAPEGMVGLELANGEVRYEDQKKRMLVYPYGVWVNDIKIKFPVASEDDYFTFEEVVDAAGGVSDPDAWWNKEEKVWDE